MESDVIVLAAGPSVREYNLRDIERRGTLITVNGAGLYTKPDIALTMDRLVAEYCCPMFRIKGIPKVYVREGTTQNFDLSTLQDVTLFKHDGKNPAYMTPVEGYLNGSNSGTCGLNLAYQMSPSRVFMVGFDMQRGDKEKGDLPYWYPPYPWHLAGAAKNRKFREWVDEFAEIGQQFEKKGIKVYNVNHRSLIETFPVVSFKEFTRMTGRG